MVTGQVNLLSEIRKILSFYDESLENVASVFIMRYNSLGEKDVDLYKERPDMEFLERELDIPYDNKTKKQMLFSNLWFKDGSYIHTEHNARRNQTFWIYNF